MIIDILPPKEIDIPRMRQIWKEAFWDEDGFLDPFFTVGFSPDRCLCAFSVDEPVAAIYWFDAAFRGKKVAYLYALATAEHYRGRGIARQLLDETHEYLRQKDYQATLLVPGNRKLAQWYQRLGYEYCCEMVDFPCKTPGEPVAIRPVSPAEYGVLRKTYLPEGSVEQDAVTLEFLATQAMLYAGENFLMAGYLNFYDFLTVTEFLGDISAVPGILGALNQPGALFRSPVSVIAGQNSTFVPQWVERSQQLPMFRPLTDPALAPPAYFAFPFS